MALSELRLDLEVETLPKAVADFLAEADRRCDAFFDTDGQKTMPRFLPADYLVVYRALEEVKANHELLGNRFCEWGSGLGAATCLAALLGFEATGIEIEGELVRQARILAEDFGLGAQFLETSFLPDGFDFLTTQGGWELLMPSGAARGGISYADADWELEDVDLFYVYPWPEEQESTLALFEALAAEGAYLVCYLGEGELCVYRKD